MPTGVQEYTLEIDAFSGPEEPSVHDDEAAWRIAESLEREGLSDPCVTIGDDGIIGVTAQIRAINLVGAIGHAKMALVSALYPGRPNIARICAYPTELEEVIEPAARAQHALVA